MKKIRNSYRNNRNTNLAYVESIDIMDSDNTVLLATIRADAFGNYSVSSNKELSVRVNMLPYDSYNIMVGNEELIINDPLGEIRREQFDAGYSKNDHKGG